jgi:DNA anti-recombination protein RmuC
MKIEVSNGELLDKLTILEIKLSRISNPGKRKNIEKEYQILHEAAGSLISKVKTLYADLLKINNQLWEAEDRIRDLEAHKKFDAEFIETARSVYHLNDERSGIKQEIDTLTGSAIREEKSYSDY